RSAGRFASPASCATRSARASSARAPISPPRSRPRPAFAEGDTREQRSMGQAGYRRVIVKVSGEALMGPDAFGLHQPTVDAIAADLVAAHGLGIGLGVVVGGGNLLRGAAVSAEAMTRPAADTMGMLATVMNALALEAAIERAGAAARSLSALAMPAVCESYSR